MLTPRGLTPRDLTRRRFLRLVGLAGLGAASIAVAPTLKARPARSAVTPSWSDPATWPNGLPGPGSVAVISQPVVLDINATVAGVIVEPAGQLIFDPGRSLTLTSAGNVVVNGKLTMRPSAPGVLHRLVFRGVNESRFMGGGMMVLPSDVGLWVMGAGILDVAGTPKVSWTRSADAISAGATTVMLGEDPVGWQVGDELLITPTLSPKTSGHYGAYDSATIRAIVGRTVTLSRATSYAHPNVQVGPGRQFTAEILNLTRNVRVEGAPGARAHVFINSSVPQTISHASLSYLGPRQPDGKFTKPVRGRYGLHFHMMGDASRGSIVQGVVVRSAGNHAFVSHESHGVTFRDCISHDTFEEPYWWDQPDTREEPVTPTDDVLYERCVASLVQCDPPYRGYRLSGFLLGNRTRNTARGCVAVGVQGNQTSSGFLWPETSVGSWTFEDCVAHNNKVHGIFVWQNNGEAHPVTRFTGYHNGGAGVSHGAYKNGYRYTDSFLYGNGIGSIELHALSCKTPQLTFVNVRCDQGGLTPYCVVTRKHSLPGDVPVIFERCDFSGYQKAAFGFLADGVGTAESFDLVDCSYAGNEFWLGPAIPAGSVVRVTDSSHGRILLRRSDQAGVLRPSWNARVSPAI